MADHDELAELYRSAIASVSGGGGRLDPELARSTSRARRRTRRGVLVVAVLVVVLAGSVAVLPGLRGGSSLVGVPPAATPTAPVDVPDAPATASSSETPAATSSSPRTGPPAARATDDGVLSASATRTIRETCRTNLDLSTPRDADVVDFARRTTQVDVVLFTDSSGHAYLCGQNGRSPLYTGFDYALGQLPVTSAERPVVRLSTPRAATSRSATGDHVGAGGALYRVDPQVASLQLRLTSDGHAGPWYEAAIDDGYAYASADLEYTGPATPPPTVPRTTVEDRAYDAAGRELDINRTPR